MSSPLPHFVETFPDDGYMDMYQVMKALRQVRFDGAAEPDHVPGLAGDTGMRRAGTAYIIAYMKALLRRANEEVGVKLAGDQAPRSRDSRSQLARLAAASYVV